MIIYRLKEARKMSGLTLRVAAKKLSEEQGINISFQRLSTIENNGCKMDSTKLIKFANFYKVPVDYLIPDPDRPKIELTDIKFFKLKNY